MSIKIFCLSGDLGTGKTTLAKHLLMLVANKFGLADRYRLSDFISPTFSIMNVYEDISCLHMDLYRLNSIDEVGELSTEDYIDDEFYTIVEWPDMLYPMLKGLGILQVKLGYCADESKRQAVYGVKQLG